MNFFHNETTVMPNILKEYFDKIDFNKQMMRIILEINK